MSRSKRWEFTSPKDGVLIIQLSSWKYFHDFITQEMLKFNNYVWRGDRCDNRELLPSFDRQYSRLTQSQIEQKLVEHLSRFKLATRGRRGPNPSKIESANDWWALGQHYGLKTPLLDWTRSPFVALFFAFENTGEGQTSNRAVYAVHPDACQSFSRRKKVSQGAPKPDIVEFFTPPQDENSRLVNQSGLFSRCTAGKPLDKWIREHHPKSNIAMLIKLLIPNKGRLECLRTLNKMNINHLTLYPDLYGASSFANMTEAINKY